MRQRRSSHRKAQLTARCFALVVGLCVAACGNAQHSEIPPISDTVDAGVASDVNLCPYFQGSLVLPQQIRSSESASLAVRATDPDAPDSQLVFRWTAASGTFSASDKPVTNYSCSKQGTAQLTVSVTDRQACSASLTLGVQCLGN